MTERMINNRVKKLLELKEQIKELEAAQKALEDEIKAEFTEDQEEIRTEKYLIRWTKVSTPRLDSTKLKKTCRIFTSSIQRSQKAGDLA